MSTALIGVIAAVCLIALLVAFLTPPDDPPPVVENPVPRKVSGPHTLIARGKIDEGRFMLVRTPLYEAPLNSVLLTQVVFDDGGAMTRARYVRASPLDAGKIIAGKHLGRPLAIIIGPGTETIGFPDDPDLNWTH